MEDIGGLDAFLRSTGAYAGDPASCTTTNPMLSTFHPDEDSGKDMSSPEYAFSPEMSGSPDAFSDEVTLVPHIQPSSVDTGYNSTEQERAMRDRGFFEGNKTNPLYTNDTISQYGVRRGSMPEAGPMSQQPLTSHGLAHLNHQGAHAGMGSSMHPMYGYGHAQMSGGAFAGDGSHAGMPPPTMTQLQGSALSSGSHGSMKKRKFELKQENFMSRGSPAESEAGMTDVSGSSTPNGADGTKRLTFIPNPPEEGGPPVAKIFSADGQELEICDFEVDAEKGFNFSPLDNAFVCQKKNHFQVAVAISINGVPKFVNCNGSVRRITGTRIVINGLKDEEPPSPVGIEQSHVDRSKKAFQPFPVEIDSSGSCKGTFTRLHFSETTANNMRKKGKPNPDQRFFKLVVQLQASVGRENFILHSQQSQRIIVRASNPGQFDGEIDMKWTKGKVPSSIVHHGPVGINTDKPFAALSVNGNITVTGTVMQPSDRRVKEDFKTMNGQEQLDNVRRLQLYSYQVKEQWAQAAGRDTEHRGEVGVIAQELQQVLPDAVTATGETVELANGERIDNLLVVDKDRIFMENVGAVQELCRMTENLENRIKELEVLQTAVVSGDLKEPLAGEFIASKSMKRRGRGKGGNKKGPGRGKAVMNNMWYESDWDDKREGEEAEPFPMVRTMTYLLMSLTIFALLTITIISVTDSDGGASTGNATSSSVIVMGDSVTYSMQTTTVGNMGGAAGLPGSGNSTPWPDITSTVLGNATVGVSSTHRTQDPTTSAEEITNVVGGSTTTTRVHTRIRTLTTQRPREPPTTLRPDRPTASSTVSENGKGNPSSTTTTTMLLETATSTS